MISHQSKILIVWSKSLVLFTCSHDCATVTLSFTHILTLILRALRELSRLLITDLSSNPICRVRVVSFCFLHNYCTCFFCFEFYFILNVCFDMCTCFALCVTLCAYACVLQHQDYRLYVIFHLKKLKVLDGSAIDLNEQNSVSERSSKRECVWESEEWVRVCMRECECVRERESVCVCVDLCPTQWLILLSSMLNYVNFVKECKPSNELL